MRTVRRPRRPSSFTQEARMVYRAEGEGRPMYLAARRRGRRVQSVHVVRGGVGRGVALWPRALFDVGAVDEGNVDGARDWEPRATSA